MTSSTLTEALPVGRWQSDATHSTATFAVKHMAVATFRGGFERIEAELVVSEDGSATLTGTVDVDSVAVKDDNLRGHLAAPDFFDTERYPELKFTSNSIESDGEHLTVSGELTIKGQTHPIQATGTITEPTETPAQLGGAVKLGLTLDAVIDRTLYGLNWNAPLPKGGVALSNEVKLSVELELARIGE